MLDQNTDRMWYVIGAVLVGAAIILIANGTIPEMFASVGDSMNQTLNDINLEDLFNDNVRRIRISEIQARENVVVHDVDYSGNGSGTGLIMEWPNLLRVDFEAPHDGTFGYGSDFVFWFHPDDTDHLKEFEYIELRFDVKSNNGANLGMRAGSNIVSETHYRIPTSQEWTTVRKKIPYNPPKITGNPKGALVLWAEGQSKVQMKNFSVHIVRDGDSE